MMGRRSGVIGERRRGRMIEIEIKVGRISRSRRMGGK